MPTATIHSATALDTKAPMDTSPELEDGEDPELPGLEPAPELSGLAVPTVPDELSLCTVPVMEVGTVAATPAETVTTVVGGATLNVGVEVATTELGELDSKHWKRTENLVADNPHSDQQLLKTTLACGCNWYK